MKKTLTCLVFLSFLFSLTGFAQSSLKIVNPQLWAGQSGDPGTIEAAEFQIEPKGLYMEVGMFLTLSAEGFGYSLQDTLEIVLDFNLPAGSIVHDSWLWMDETLIVKADVYEQGEAKGIYEDIVDRRRDPSLLYQKDNRGYQLRIFPLAGTESRRVKITYLVPAIWGTETVSSWLPIELLQNSYNPLAEFKVISIADDNWGQPSLKGVPNIAFESVQDPDVGAVWVATITADDFRKPIRFAVDSPLNEDGIYISKLEESEEEKLYQLAYMPPEMPVSSEAKNVLVLFNHDPVNTTIDKTDLFDFVKQNIEANFRTQDQINLMFSDGDESHMASDSWVSCDPGSLEQLFSSLDDPISNESDIVQSLTTAIEFIKANGGEGEVMLLSSASQWFSFSTQITAWKELIGADNISINIINYQSLNYYWEEVWNEPSILNYNYRNLYNRATYETGGRLFSALDQGMNTYEIIEFAFSSFDSAPYIFDLDVDASAGLVYGSYYQDYVGQSTNLNQPILQVGKYIGGLPSSIDFSAYNDGVFVNDSKTIDPADIMTEDSLLREIWIGHLIKEMEASVNSNSEKNDIIDLSKRERVLSKYTAFLALEVAQGGELCPLCWSLNEIIISTDDDVLPTDYEVNLSANPTPFSDYCNLTIDIAGVEMPKEVNAYIFDSFGKLVHIINAEQALSSGTLQYTWYGKDINGNQLPPGIYHLVVQTEKRIETIKLALLK